MSERLSRLVGALMPVMNRTQAEGFLHLTATSRNKRMDALSIDDWPALEGMVRDALRGTSSERSADEVCERLWQAFLEEVDGREC